MIKLLKMTRIEQANVYLTGIINIISHEDDYNFGFQFYFHKQSTSMRFRPIQLFVLLSRLLFKSE
jgi:hypothetical protein